ncbi:antitoxin MazE family protein [Reyranella sp.]|uniref:antitoxin MazE family protein n=1 Tax=Reyranella sp. TaxID=1929291 RepID=UPI003BAADBFB
MSGKRARAQERRDRPQALALRPIQLWVPDMRSAAFTRKAHRQSLAVAKTGRAHEDQAFVDAASDWQDE